MVRLITYSLLFFMASTSCIERDQLRPMVPEFLLHAHGSKVWVLQTHLINDEDVMTIRKESTPTLTFFDNGEVYEQELINLGGPYGLKSIYSLRIHEELNDTILSFYSKYSGKLSTFKVKALAHKRLILETMDTFPAKETRKFVPLTKPF